MFRKLGIGLLIFIIFVAIFSIVSKDDSGNIQKVEKTFAQQKKDFQVWHYDESYDKMRNVKSYFAHVESLNKLFFNFPYHGGSTVTLTLRKCPISGDKVFITIDKGQFFCGYNDCAVNIKFDSGKIEMYPAGKSASGKSDILFINPYKTLVKKIKASKQVIIEAEFFKEGKRQIEFNVAGLKWDY